MRAAGLTSLGVPLQILDRPVPEPGPGQVRVRIETSGCATPTSTPPAGDWPVKPTAPFVPRRESAGVVDALVAGVTASALGTRVALPRLGHAYGSCRYCVGGSEILCARSRSRCRRASTRCTPPR
jgi:propanol-preferring alcohol dehydrogenase